MQNPVARHDIKRAETSDKPSLRGRRANSVLSKFALWCICNQIVSVRVRVNQSSNQSLGTNVVTNIPEIVPVAHHLRTHRARSQTRLRKCMRGWEMYHRIACGRNRDQHALRMRVQRRARGYTTFDGRNMLANHTAAIVGMLGGIWEECEQLCGPLGMRVHLRREIVHVDVNDENQCRPFTCNKICRGCGVHNSRLSISCTDWPITYMQTVPVRYNNQQMTPCLDDWYA